MILSSNHNLCRKEEPGSADVLRQTDLVVTPTGGNPIAATESRSWLPLLLPH